MSEIKEYHSSFTGPEVDALLTKVKDGSITADIKKELANKANVNGRYPEMSVGFADDLVGRGESVPAEFSFRASGGKSIKDGAARIKRLKGNSVVWNQNINNVLSASTSLRAWLPRRGVDYASIENGEITLRFDSQSDAFGNSIRQRINVKAGDKFFISYDYESHNVDEFGRRMFIALTSGWSSRDVLNGKCSAKGGDVTGHVEAISVVPSKDDIDSICLYFCYTGITSPDTTPLKVSNFRFVNLTKMFGAEEAAKINTIEDYNARKPIVADEYAYNEGEVIHMTAEGVKSVGDNAWDEEWRTGIYASSTGEYAYRANSICNANAFRILPNEEYWVNVNTEAYFFCYDEDMQFIKYLYTYQPSKILTPANAAYMNFYCSDAYGTTYNHDIMITLVHSGWKQDTDAGYQPYWEDRLIFDQRIKDEFPDGMSKWDMVYNKNGKGYIVHGLGVVDMGELKWGISDSSGGGLRFTTERNEGFATSPNNTIGNIICAKYVTHSADDVYSEVHGIAIGISGSISVYDPSYSDINSFKAAMAGVPLYYELAEPTIIEYDEPFNLDYRVADFGTEQAIAEQPSAPISADIIYQFNAVDMIREHELEIAELQSIIATMQAQLASLTNKE